MSVQALKTLSEEQFSSDSDAHWSHESMIFLHNEEIELKTDLLNKKACSIWFLYWILSEQKKSDRCREKTSLLCNRFEKLSNNVR